VAHGERGHPTLPRCRTRCPIGSLLQGTTPLVLPHEGAWVVLSFDSVCESGGERESESAKKKQIKKPSSSLTTRLGEEE
jgi:hypothetical protein